MLLCIVLAPHRSPFKKVWSPNIINRLIVSGKFDSKDECVFWISEKPRQIRSSAVAGRTFCRFLWHLCCTKVPEARGEAFDTAL